MKVATLAFLTLFLTSVRLRGTAKTDSISTNEFEKY